MSLIMNRLNNWGDSLPFNSLIQLVLNPSFYWTLIMPKLEQQQFNFIKSTLMEKVGNSLPSLLEEHHLVVAQLEQECETSRQILELFSELEKSRKTFFTEKLHSSKENTMLKEFFKQNTLGLLNIDPNEVVQNLEILELSKEKTLTQINFLFWKKLASIDQPLFSLLDLDNLSFDDLRRGEWFNVKLFDRYYSYERDFVITNPLHYFRELNNEMAFNANNIARILHDFVSIDHCHQFFANETEITPTLEKEELDTLFVQAKINHLLNSSDEMVKRFIQQNEFKHHTLAQLAHHDNHLIRAEIARKDEIDEILVELLAHDKSPIVRWTVAERKTLPLTLINILANDENQMVCTIIAERNDLPKELKKQLAHFTTCY